MLINGEVMPRRANQEILRGEDACFIVESYKEREMAVFGQQPAVHQMDFAIRGGRLWDAAQWYRDYVDRGDDKWSPMALDISGIKSSYQIDSETNKTGTGRPPSNIDSSLVLRRNRLKSTPFDFAKNNPVRKQPILDLYYDINLVKTFQTNAPANITNPWASGIEYDIVKTGDYEFTPAERPTILNWDVFRGSTIKQEMKTGYGRFEVILGRERMKYIGNCKIFAAYDVFINRNNEDDDPAIKDREFHAIFYPTTAIRNQTGFSIGAADVVQHMEDIKTRLNMNFDPWNPNGGIDRAYIRAFCEWIIIEMNDRTVL